MSIYPPTLKEVRPVTNLILSLLSLYVSAVLNMTLPATSTIEGSAYRLFMANTKPLCPRLLSSTSAAVIELVKFKFPPMEIELFSAIDILFSGIHQSARLFMVMLKSSVIESFWLGTSARI